MTPPLQNIKAFVAKGKSPEERAARREMPYADSWGLGEVLDLLNLDAVLNEAGERLPAEVGHWR